MEPVVNASEAGPSAYATYRDASLTQLESYTCMAEATALSAVFCVHTGNSGSATQDQKLSEHAPPAAPLITPLQMDSPQSLSQAAEAPADWRPGPICLPFNSAQGRTAAARPRCTSQRDLAN
jgi:hypothetical protein